MSLPTGLFIDAPEMHDASMTAMSQLAEEWPEELTQKLKERIPETESMSVIVKIMKKDEENGTATGSLVITNASKTAVVPIIMKDFQLYPFDVFICNGKLLPLTPDFFRACFQSNTVFQKLEEYPSYGGLGRFEDSNLWHATYPPSLGRYAYASANYPVINSLEGTIDGTELKAALRADEAAAVRFHKHGHADVIKKLASLQHVNMNEFRQGAEKLIPKNIHMLKKDGPNKYSILSNSDSTFSPSLVSGTRGDMMGPGGLLAKLCATPQDMVNDVDQNGEKMLAVPTAVDNGEVYVEGPINHPVEIASEYGNFVVRKANGVECEGVVIPTVINFAMGLVPVRVFLGKTFSTLQTEIAGIRVKNSHWAPKPQSYRVGQTGVFVFFKGPSKALCTIPVTIKSMHEDWPGGEAVLKVVDLQGVTYKVKTTAMHLERIAQVSGVFCLPKEFQWFPMEGFDEVSSNPFDYAAKTAGLKKTAAPVKLIATGYGQYCVKGAEKYARAAGWDPTFLDRGHVLFLLTSLGMGSEKIAEAVKKANSSGQAIIHGLKTPPLASEKVAAAIPIARKMSKVAADLRSDLTKAASYVENSQTVDALLSLNFVTPENVARFVGKLPSFKNAISNLASCLIASRLGVKEIPEQAVATAMTRLIDVVNGLEALRATQEG